MDTFQNRTSAGNEELRQEAWKHAIETYGTAHIFEVRAEPLKKQLKLLTYMGLAGFVTLGAVLAAFGPDQDLLKPMLVVVGVVSVGQALVALWAVIARWDDALAYSLESMADNYRLSGEYERLARHAPPDFESQLAVLNAENRAREAADYRQGIDEAEKRRGMRAGLRKFQRACDQCKQVPTSMVPSKCPVCGNY